MPPIPKPEFPTQQVLTYMLEVTGAIVIGLILMTILLAILTYLVRFVFFKRVRYQIVPDGVGEIERYFKEHESRWA